MCGVGEEDWDDGKRERREGRDDGVKECWEGERVGEYCGVACIARKNDEWLSCLRNQ